MDDNKRYKVSFWYEDDNGKWVSDEFTHSGMGFTREQAKKLVRILKSCGHRGVMPLAIR